MAVAPLAGRTVFVVVDGAGGVAGGAVAAETVCEAVVEQCRRDDQADWVRCLGNVDRSMSVGQAAAVVVEIREDGTVVGASVGDCEVWIFEDGGHRSLTAGQSRKPLLGEGRAIPVGFETVSNKCTIVAATDGLWKYLDRASIVRAVAAGPLDEVVDALVAGVRTRSGVLQDDVCVALAEMS